MIFIEFEGKTPCNTPANPDFAGWSPWSQEAWNTWLQKSQDYAIHIQKLHQEGKTQERNQFIDEHASHWGSLKPWLQVLSNGKCWFSEVRELYSHYDVEHFRPKKEAKALDGTLRDGYWYLAFDYTNFRLCGNVGNRKKGGWFPLKTGSICSSFDNQCEESEAPYLLDPTDPADVNLLAFDEEGNAIPAPGISEWERQRVEVSILRLKLNEHEPLTNERRKIWQKVSREIEQYLYAKSRSASGDNPAAKEKVRSHLLKIRSMTMKHVELSSVAKWCLLFRNDPQLLKLAA
ncbi:hypothetical protein [Candidatus Nitrospira neomarina]|uniref:TIGR02646 family protein n=1 Tax=Candidatus Nitrospira neomarina TaxID=3020899 RepID=A0AA96GU16_9BACT|nr:hypothetical protein [Candidatus Nitrospira neomarina]WNM63551.1 hypothetical protein PQG83_07295 [Candidatus Nitrospira neomarina]